MKRLCVYLVTVVITRVVSAGEEKSDLLNKLFVDGELFSSEGSWGA